jgi:DnaJ-class molecular chaperone
VSIDEILSSKTLKEVKNEGMPILENGKPSRKGNLYVRFDILFPQQLSE